MLSALLALPELETTVPMWILLIKGRKSRFTMFLLALTSCSTNSRFADGFRRFNAYAKHCNIQIKICAECRDMLPRPMLVCQEPRLRPIGRNPGVPEKSSRGLGSMSRYSAQILICFVAYFIHFFLFLCGFGWELCRTASMHSALCHCPL